MTGEPWRRLVNLTPHVVAIKVDGSDEIIEVEPRATPARLAEISQREGRLDVEGDRRVKTRALQLLAVADLPEARRDTLLIVSRPIAMKYPERGDLVVPGGMVRDAAGQPLYAEFLDQLNAEGLQSGGAERGSRRSARALLTRSRWFSWLRVGLYAAGLTVTTAAGGLALEQLLGLVGDSGAASGGLFLWSLAAAVIGGILLGSSFALTRYAKRWGMLYLYLGVFSPKFPNRHRMEGEQTLFATWASSASHGFGTVLRPLERHARSDKSDQIRSACRRVVEDAALSLRQAGQTLDEGVDVTVLVNARLSYAFVLGRMFDTSIPVRRPLWVAADRNDLEMADYLSFSSAPCEPDEAEEWKILKRSYQCATNKTGLSDCRCDSERTAPGGWGCHPSHANTKPAVTAIALDVTGEGVEDMGKAIGEGGASHAVLLSNASGSRMPEDAESYRRLLCEFDRVRREVLGHGGEVHFYYRGPAAIAFAAGLMWGASNVRFMQWEGGRYIPIDTSPWEITGGAFASSQDQEVSPLF